MNLPRPVPTVLVAAAFLASLHAFAAAADAPAGGRPDTLVRERIAPEYRWDFRPIYPDWAAWDSDMARVDGLVAAFVARRGTLGRGPQALLEACQARDAAARLADRLYNYAQLQHDVDTRDQAVGGRLQRVTALVARIEADTAWFQPELLALPKAQVDAWVAATPALAPYAYGIASSFRQQAHVLDAQGERLLSLAGPVGRAPTDAYGELSTSDIKFPSVTTSDGRSVVLTPGAYGALLEHEPSQAVRARAAAAHVGAYGAQANTYAALYAGVLQRDWFNAQARKFPSTLDAALDAYNVPRSVVETLIETTRAGTAPLQRYARLRRKMLGLADYHLYDSFRPLVAAPRSYPYPVALDQVIASVAPLGEAYVQRYRKFVTGGRVDVYENEGKRSGAYNAGVYGVGPYLLLNHNDTLDAMFTLAHEGGHAMHTVLSYEHQPYSTSEATIFVAEVASTTNERFLLESLLKKSTDPKERFLLLQHAVDSIVDTFYTQVLFADFELQAHRLVEQGQPATAEALDSLYAGVLRTYYGDALSVDDFYKWTWARIPHFFNTPYYVYQYATCFASSAQLFDAMNRGSDAARQAATARYLALLESGGNDDPMAQLKKAGVDLTRRSTVQAVVDQLDALVSRMEIEAAKIGS